ncbi:MAG: TetR/AcrR family transcriptional regulator [Gaiellaceae bacterium]
MSTPSATRLPAAERRQAVIEAALTVFSAGSYSGATTAQIAREAGVSEPILYRHFESKRHLYVACLDEAWARLRGAFEARIAELGPQNGVLAIGQTATRLRALGVLPPNLWIQALTEAGDDPEIRKYLRSHMREVHDFVRDVVLEAQRAGGVPPDRDAEAEAWVFIGAALLVSVADRLGGLLGHADFAAIATQRRRWLTGEN